jgi:predicted patatin/cPLA2 family phospholipase
MLGLIDVGGGTRGAFGAGVLDRCIDEGITFDYLIGVSAGSANEASFLAGQKGRNLRFYDGYAFRKEYMSMRLMLKTRQYLDLDYIYSTLTNSDGEDPLDYDAMMDQDVEWEIVATDAVTGKAEYFPKQALKRDEYDVIKASCAVPGACRPYIVDGLPYFDGGIADPIPYERALEAGCDRLVVILTKPRTELRKAKSKDSRIAPLIRRKYPKVAKRLELRYLKYNLALAEVLKMEEEGKALVISPDDMVGMKTLKLDHKQVRALYKRGYDGAEKIKGFIESINSEESGEESFAEGGQR